MKSLLRAMAYAWRQLTSRHIYIVTMLLVPVLGAFFFIDLMDPGLPVKVPAAVVDLDHSSLSRRVTRNLASSELIDIKAEPTNYTEARDMVRTGRIYGFFLIPDEFEKDAYSDRDATITYYCNMTYFVPGTMAFKGFKTQAVTTVGGLAVATLTSAGIPDDRAGELVNPVSMDIRAPGNPWLNYNYYLSNSFIPALLALMVALVTSFSICVEIKDGTSRRWLHAAGGSMAVALMGKLIVQFAIWSVTGLALVGAMYGIGHFPLNCPVWRIILAMEMLIIATQWFAVTWCCLLPNLRLAVSMCSLSGILAFSIAAFSFPVDQMYGGVGIFSYILPVRYYFLIYIDQALNGIDLFYSRHWLAALMVFPLVGLLGLRRLHKRCVNPIYVP